mmetsp:Transcript_60920/g.98647  ORF Transcript_60920/g.98647 Transcript_60920/m.98647 type:complete len:201 (+) Transcript_60920:1211-1813(+)
MQRTSHGACNASSIVGVVCRFAGNELAAALGEGDHDRTAGNFSCLQACVDGIGSHNVHSWNRELVLLGVVQQVHQRLACDHTWLHGGRHLREDLLSHRSGLAHHLGTALAALAHLGCCREGTGRAQGQHTHCGRGGRRTVLRGCLAALPQGPHLLLLAHLRACHWAYEGLAGGICADAGQRHGARLGRHAGRQINEVGGQ